MRYRDGIPTNDLTGEALWQYIMKCVEQDEQLKMKMEEAIKEGTKTFRHTSLQQEGIIHPSTKQEAVIQFTYFDKYGAVGDLESESGKEMTDKIFNLGFSFCEVEDFQYTLLAGDKDKKPINKSKQNLEIEI
ncbi:hypothetical protein [Oceanobacillus sp. CF4.6]|uniref:hypothetical protein n=1 Tax=Oceanobacillus sp. CF4.6 TaxID=3373080 RepID=UPI003EE51FFF